MIQCKYYHFGNNISDLFDSLIRFVDQIPVSLSYLFILAMYFSIYEKNTLQLPWSSWRLLSLAVKRLMFQMLEVKNILV